MRTSTLLAVLWAGSLLAAPVPKGDQKAAPLNGTWEVVERHLSGARDDSASPIRWTIDGEGLGIQMRQRAGFQKVVGVTYRLVKPERAKAGELDYVVTPDDKEIPPTTFHGVFELDGDTLKISIPNAAGHNRPAACAAAAGTDLYVFKRVKEEK